MKYYSNILDGIGNTPLIKLSRITEGADIDLFAKLEFLNPVGSVKDRIAKYMIEKAEKEGRIKPGDTIIDSSSGNTAMGLAVVCSVKGYKLKIIIRRSTSIEKIKFLRALNVDLVMVDPTLPPESPDSYNNLAPRIAAGTPGAYYFDQHNNLENNETHYKTTGPEIWEQMEGKIDYFIAGMGTGGTICGAGKYLKEKDPNIKVIAIDPLGSIFYDYFFTKKIIKPAHYIIEGLGDEFLIGCADFSVLDDIYQVTDKEAFLMTRKLASIEGILAGGSSGAAVWGALKLAKNLNRPARVVTIIPDSANRYLSTIYNDDWLKEKGFLATGL
ncbi:MAG: cysteine synthase family protein [Candidatus Aminicenantes bacterium]|nr:cysteine synthase family protein [Candidatus Aminicenantes bacterium]